jgi:hypothetical protein
LFGQRSQQNTTDGSRDFIAIVASHPSLSAHLWQYHCFARLTTRAGQSYKSYGHSLIAAAMDPQPCNSVRRSFIDTVQRLDPLDTFVLKMLCETREAGPLSPNVRDYLATTLSLSAREIEVSALNLGDLKCVHIINIGPTDNFVITSYGIELVRACSA